VKKGREIQHRNRGDLCAKGLSSKTCRFGNTSRGGKEKVGGGSGFLRDLVRLELTEKWEGGSVGHLPALLKSLISSREEEEREKRRSSSAASQTASHWKGEESKPSPFCYSISAERRGGEKKKEEGYNTGKCFQLIVNTVRTNGWRERRKCKMASLVLVEGGGGGLS